VPLGDVRGIDYGKLPKGDWLITGGFPCQDISAAGRRAGLEGKRSGLFAEFIRLIGGIRPAYAVMENTANLAGWFDAGKGRHAPAAPAAEGSERTVEIDQYQALARCAGYLSEIGYDAEWAPVRASDAGAFHRRERIWIVAYPSAGGGREKETPVAYA
jgi:DNA (cytosine-5)-methyltransferase 1